jgi:transcriptional regulator with XRE-family HTH domain
MTAVYSPEQHAFYRELGAFMRKSRKSRGMSAEDLAYETEVSRSTIMGVERGNYKISVYLLLRILQYLEIPVSILDDVMCIAKTKPVKPTRQEIYIGA